MQSISKSLALCTVHRFLFACRKREPHGQFRRGCFQYCTFSASACRVSVCWVCSSCSCYGSFLSFQKGSYTRMDMHDGHISICLVGGEERCNCIGFPVYDVSGVRIYKDSAVFEFSIGLWACGPFPPSSMAVPPSRSSGYPKGRSSSF